MFSEKLDQFVQQYVSQNFQLAINTVIFGSDFTRAHRRGIIPGYIPSEALKYLRLNELESVILGPEEYKICSIELLTNSPKRGLSTIMIKAVNKKKNGEWSNSPKGIAHIILD